MANYKVRCLDENIRTKLGKPKSEINVYQCHYF